jgi:transposase
LAVVPRSLRCERRLVFVDESGFHIAMDRLRARAPTGQRAYGKVPRNRGKNLTLIASMSLHGMGGTMVVEGSTDAEAFEVYVEHFLAPTLQQGQVVVFDNLGAHKPQRIRELIEARGAQVLFLPSYSSPDFNPIEEAFSKIKGIVRKAGARTYEALLEAIAQALWAITAVDAAGWFSHSGYEVEVQYL